jgi:hypothetical protein
MGALRAAQVVLPLVLATVSWTSSGWAAPQPMTRDEIMGLAQSGVGYSYWWGNGCWRTDGTQHGSCSGSCPNCTHSGSYGADCSGFAAKAWQVPGPSAVNTCSHPYSTYNFTCQSTHWSHPARGTAEKGDALSYRSGGCPGEGGHVVIYERGDPWGDMWMYEARGCSYGIVHNSRSLSSSYTLARRNNLTTGCTPSAEVCNGRDDDCNNQVDEGGVCVLEDELNLQAGVIDGSGTSDINGDGKADICARAAAGVRCQLSQGTSFGTHVVGPELSNATGWDDVTNASTLRMADVNGDGRADLCARANDGVRCWVSNGFGFATSFSGPLSDEGGWNDVQYYGTIRFADVDGDGKEDLCARGYSGFRCWPSTGSGFGAAISGPEWSTASGWGGPDHAGTIRMGDVNGDGKADVCARGAAGIFCYLSNGAGFPTRVNGPAWSDGDGWTDISHWSTIRLADINGDGKADICARTATDFRCHLSQGTSFGVPVTGPALSNAAGWGDYDNYATIRMGDVNGDGKADLCARANAGMRCWLSLGNGFGSAITGPELSDDTGWNGADHHRTIRLADINGDGKADLCARAAAGVRCWLWDGNGFPTMVTGPEWSDAVGWAGEPYYSSIRMAGPAARPAVPDAGVDAGTRRDGSVTRDAAVGAADAGPSPPDASQPARDAAAVARDGGAAPQTDAADFPPEGPGDNGEDGLVIPPDLPDGGAGEEGAGQQGCACRAQAGSSAHGAWTLAVLAVWAWRRGTRRRWR